MLAGAPGLSLAQSPLATVRGVEQQNFGRIAIQLPTAQKTTARIANGVLVIGFSEPVDISVDRIIRELPSYVSVARVDPDGRGMRLALTRTFRVNHLEAAEKVFVDLIPENWQGLLPSLPADVVEDLARRARAAEALARDARRFAEQPAVREVTVRTASLPTLSRIVFELPSQVVVDHAVEARAVEIALNAPLKLDGAQLRAALPTGVQLERLEAAAGAVRIRLSLPEHLAAKGFREDEGFVLDLTDKRRSASTPASTPAEAPAPAPAQAQAPTQAPAAPAQGQAQTQAQAPAPPARAAAEPPRTAAAEAPAPPKAAAAPAPQPQPQAEAAPAPARTLPPQKVTVTASQMDDGARVDFQFPRRTAAAAFQDKGEVVIVFDTIDLIEPADLLQAAARQVAAASASREGKATVLRLQMRQPGLVRFAPDAMRWSLTTGDKGVQAAEPLASRRAADERGQTVIAVPLAGVSGVHWIGADSGAPMAVATGYGPGAAMPKPQRFVEFQLEQTMQGVVVRPLADDLAVRAGVGEVVISRGGGLAVTFVAERANAALPGKAAPELFPDRKAWAEMRLGSTREQMIQLQQKAADAPRSERSAARLKLASFLLANELHAESLGPVATLLRDDPNFRTDRRPHLSRAIAQTLMERSKEAEETLGAPFLRDDAEAALWRAVNDARQGRFPRALAGLRRAGEIIDAYPEQLQAPIRLQTVRAAIAMRDLGVAERELSILASLAPNWLPRDEVELLRAQLDDASGRPEAALAGYRALFESPLRPVSARAQLLAVQLVDREHDTSMSPEETLARLETVALTWRGGDVEIEAIGELGAIYAGQQRWRDAFNLARKANGYFPDHPVTRKLHDDTARLFEELFTTGKADQLPRVEALALFYDFKEFLPIGRRGDEITRRLADRLVELDLLEQAGELLQHQIDNRLTGAARATVAARLAMIRLMNNKPAEALGALASSRIAELPRDVKRARQLLEAKALSDLSRTDLALEILIGERGPEIDRLKADILWSARRWREAGEEHERILGDAWQSGAPLTDRQRADAMRAAVAYVMAAEALSLDRLRAKYAAPMSQTPDARTFAFVTGANRGGAADIRELARNFSSADTLMEFMTEYRKRYPDYASTLRSRQKPEAPKDAPPAETPESPAPKQAENAPPAPGRPG